MDDVTVFAFSQVGTKGNDATNGQDQQVLMLRPDMVIRGWAQWDLQGSSKSSYDSTFVDMCRDMGIRFMGGGTATALFYDQVPAKFDSFVTRDAAGAPVKHDDLNLGEYRGSLANPDYRQHLIDIATYQIVAGVDGLQYSDVNASYQGSIVDGTGDGNEGFDDYHLADFNAFLLAKYPDA